MSEKFSGKKVLVTGGSRGIGRAVCEAFAKQGATLAVNYRSDRGGAEETLRSLPGSGHVAIQADVSDPAGAEALIQKTVEQTGGLDVLVNNAGVSIFHRVIESGYDEWQAAWQKTIKANLLGPANLSFLAAKEMMNSGGGRIVNISSRGAFRGEPEKPAYGASKAGLNAMSQSLAQALAPHNIFVGVVAPGFVETDMVAERLAGPEGEELRADSPLGRVARAEEVAEAVLFLASPGTEFTTGTIIDVNGASYLRS